MSARLISAVDVADELGVPVPILGAILACGALPYIQTPDGPYVESVDVETFQARYRTYEHCPDHWVTEALPEQPERAERPGVVQLVAAAAAVLTLGMTAGAWLIQLGSS